MIRLKYTALAAAAALALAAPAMAEALALVGDWHGTIASPQGGDITLVLHVTEDESGALKAQVENAYQAPGNMADIDTISVKNGHPGRSTASGATFEGDRVEVEQEWRGEFNQGIKVPMAFDKGLPPPFPVIEGMDGVWQGVAELNGAKLRQVVAIRTGERGTVVIYSSPDQLLGGIPVRDLKIDGQKATFSLMNGSSNFEGALNDARTEVAGKFTTTLNDNVATVTMTRGEFGATARLGRPQEPKEPFPYRVEQVAFDNPQWPGVHLVGTLTVPARRGPVPRGDDDHRLGRAGPRRGADGPQALRGDRRPPDPPRHRGAALRRPRGRRVQVGKEPYDCGDFGRPRHRRQCRLRLSPARPQGYRPRARSASSAIPKAG